MFRTSACPWKICSPEEHGGGDVCKAVWWREAIRVARLLKGPGRGEVSEWGQELSLLRAIFASAARCRRRNGCDSI